MERITRSTWKMTRPSPDGEKHPALWAWVLTAALLVSVSTAFAVRGLTRTTEKAERETARPAGAVNVGSNPTTTSDPTEKLPAQVILLRPHGFEPAEITRKGRFLLAVLNRSGVREANYLLTSVASNKLHEAKVPREKLDWHQVVDLTPGDYILRETNHPDWTCKITVTPQ